MGKLRFQSRAGGHYSPAPAKPKARPKVSKLRKARIKKESKKGGDK